MSTQGGDTRSGLLAVVAIAAVVTFGLTPLVPPSPVSASAPAAEFSAERAQAHVRSIAAVAHPIGSEPHAVVREYILAQLRAVHLDPAVQEADVTREGRRGEPSTLVRVRNIVATLKGTGPAKAVLLGAHYDSAPSSPGAGDNAAAVATLLETARALRAAPPLTNDVILLFTDGEEAGLLGARAFVAAHPLASTVGLVLNFDARGSSGPVVMFESAKTNDWLMGTFARAAPYPVATSLSEEVYRRMPNSTDFAVFKQAGYAGLNFAFFAEGHRYHNALDSIEHLDPRTLQHQGSYALSLARAFGTTNPPSAAGEATVHFNVGRSLLVRYGGALARMLAAIAVLLWIAVAVVGVMRRALTRRGVIIGIITVCAVTLGAAATGYALERGIRITTGGRRPDLAIELRNLAVVCGATLLVTLAIFRLAWNRIASIELMIPVLGVWTALAFVVTGLVPGASYLFVWPAIVGLLGVGVGLLRPQGETRDAAVWLASGAVPAAILLPSMFVLIHIAMGPRVTIGMTVIAALALGLFVPALQLIAVPRVWRVPMLLRARITSGRHVDDTRSELRMP
jgi:hypothetical protein